MSNLVITIGRQCGSRGKTIGKKVAEALGVKCYDKELLTEAAKHSGLCEELDVYKRQVLIRSFRRRAADVY